MKKTPNEMLFDALSVLYRKDTLKAVKDAVADGANVNATDMLGRCPLELANDFKIIKFLVEHGADVNHKDRVGRNRLYYCSDARTLRYFIDHGADVNFRDVEGRTPLMIAAEKQNVPVVKLLLKSGANPNIKDKSGKTMMEYIYEPYPDDVQSEHQEEVWKHSPEYDEWSERNSRIHNEIEFLVKSTSKKTSPKDLFNALYVKKNYELARLLIERGAEVNAKDKDGKTPLMYVIQALYDENDVKKGLGMADFLIKKGANINAKQKDGWSALSLSHNVAVIKWLAKKGADVNTQDNYGMTPLMSASADEWGFERVKCLLELGANPNVKDKNGATALLYAAGSSYDDVKMIKMLIEYGADPKVKNDAGMGALQLAVKQNKKQEVVFLEKFSKISR